MKALIVASLCCVACGHARDHGVETEKHAVLKRGITMGMGHGAVSVSACGYGSDVADGQTREGPTVRLRPLEHDGIEAPEIIIGEGSVFEVGDFKWRASEIWDCGAVAERIGPLRHPVHERLVLDNHFRDQYLGDTEVSLRVGHAHDGVTAVKLDFIDDVALLPPKEIKTHSSSRIAKLDEAVEINGEQWKLVAASPGEGKATFERLSPYKEQPTLPPPPP